MSFLLDTNVVSEWTRDRPNAGVVAWLAEVDEDAVFLSVVTLLELRYGIETMARGRRRQRLELWLTEELLPRFDGRIVPIDSLVADECGQILARREARGRPMGAMDSLIAATAVVHGFTLVTRNERDFADSVEAVLNPWIAGS